MRAAAAGLALALASAGLAAAEKAGGIAVADLAYAEGDVQVSNGPGWSEAKEGTRLRLGQKLRAGPESVARIEFPWMAVTIGPSSEISVAPTLVLALALERGRAELASEGRDIVKLRTPEGEVRGRGHVVVRRNEKGTLVSALRGAFRLEKDGRAHAVSGGNGLLVVPGGRTEALALPEAPTEIVPAADPRYVRRGRTVWLTWTSAAPAHHVQLLPVDSDAVLISRDSGPAPVSLPVPWPGTYRWRVSARDARGLEGPPSGDGLVCVIED